MGSAEGPRSPRRAALEARVLRCRHSNRTVRRGRFLIEGPAALAAAVEVGWPIDEVVYSKRLCTSGWARRTVQHLARGDPPIAVTRVEPDAYRRLSATPRASGVLAIVRERYVSLDRLRVSEASVFLAAGGIRSAGNLGTMLRTLLAVDGAGFVGIGPRIDPFAPATVRSSMGASLRLPTARCDVDALRAWAVAKGVRLVGASPCDGEVFDAFSFCGPTAILLGAEREGLSNRERECCDAFVHLPIVGPVDSLNVGVAGSILLYEALRQRRGARAGRE